MAVPSFLALTILAGSSLGQKPGRLSSNFCIPSVTPPIHRTPQNNRALECHCFPRRQHHRLSRLGVPAPACLFFLD